MKKIIALFLMVAVVCSLAITASAVPGNDNLGTVPALSSAPTVDGKIDDVYKNEALKLPLSKYITDFSYYEETCTATAYVGINGSSLYVCVDASYNTPLEEYNKWWSDWQQEQVEILVDWHNNASLGKDGEGKWNKVGKTPTVIENLIQYRVDLASNTSGSYVINAADYTSMKNPSDYFNAAAKTNATQDGCVYEFEIFSPISLTEGTEIGVLICLQDMVNSGANYCWYYTDAECITSICQWYPDEYPVLTIGAGGGGSNEHYSGEKSEGHAANTADTAIIASASVLVLGAAVVVFKKKRH